MNATSAGRGCALNQGVLKTLMISFAMVMRDKLRHRSSEIAFPNRNDPVETLLLHGPSEPLRVRIRVRPLIGCGSRNSNSRAGRSIRQRCTTSDFCPTLTAPMRNLPLTLLHAAIVAAKLCGPGGIRSVIAENLLLKHQLLVLRRARR